MYQICVQKHYLIKYAKVNEEIKHIESAIQHLNNGTPMSKIHGKNKIAKPELFNKRLKSENKQF